MVKRKSKGSLLGRSSSGSKDNNSGLYLVSIVAIVAIVALFLMVKGGSSEVSGETVMVADEEGNLVGEAFMNMGSLNVFKYDSIKPKLVNNLLVPKNLPHHVHKNKSCKTNFDCPNGYYCYRNETCWLE